jgi:hypothetical protein
MKKYVIPVTELFQSDLENFVCASPTGQREGQWGAGGDGTNPYANPDYDNEGYNTGGTDPIVGDDGEIDAQGKAWGDLWGDFGF